MEDNVVEDTSPGVSTVFDTKEYYDAFYTKTNTAHWVRGLEYDEVVEEVKPTPVPEEAAASSRKALYVSRWLRTPLLLCACYVCLGVFECISGLENNLAYHFPAAEQQLTPFCPYEEQSLLSFLNPKLDFIIPSTVLSISTMLLCFSIGSAAHNFFALCGVGISILSLVAHLFQPLVLWTACGVSSVSDEWECDVSLVLVWICSVLSVVGPVLSLCCMAGVLDQLWSTRFKWRLITAVPLVMYTVLVARAALSGSPNYSYFTYANYIALGTTASLLCALWYQREFEVVLVSSKPHMD